MTTLKCKMCGGDLNFEEGATVCECEYCGSKQTVPKVDDEKKINLFARANRLRLNCEFDKACGIYESIVSEFPEEAEGYWGILLCKYGIEYVDDPATAKKIPTCHRSSFENFLDDEDFELVMEYSDPASRAVYREEAKYIEELRKGIIEVSGKEEPYDIFICYKETDVNGERTLDSVLAQDVYDALTARGYRVFFSRISLEDKLGLEYEPYIFAALNSAKVMLAFGTDYEYFNAVWVKNEWSRYLKLMAQDKEKHLIPCYKNVDAYDMPKEFAKLQAQDLGKVGATQDLMRGIDKLIGKNDDSNTEKVSNVQPQTVIQQVVSGGANIDALLRRGYDSLEDGAFDEAKGYFDDALNYNAKSAEAYLGLMMVEMKTVNQNVAKEKYINGNYTENRYWKRAVQYAEGNFANLLNAWESQRAARLQREMEAARKVKEEADQKAREAEEKEKKKQECIRKLQEQLYSGQFEMTSEEQAEQERLKVVAKSTAEIAQTAGDSIAKSSEMQKVSRLEGEISSSKKQLSGLGIFKGKEKKELQKQIEILEEALSVAKNKVIEKQSEISRLKQEAEDAEKQAKEYYSKTMILKKKPILKQIFQLQLSDDIIKFGSYEQGNGIEPIEWRILERIDSRLLLITKYAIDCKKYHETLTDITWEKCDLRKWLNNEFLNKAFLELEQSLIRTTICPASKNPTYDTPPGNATIDKIFLLSISEAEKYFKSDEDRRVALTAYAKKQSVSEDEEDEFDFDNEFKTVAGEDSWWWLRSPGFSSLNAADVSSDGSVDGDGYCVDNVPAVRPALWIDISNL